MPPRTRMSSHGRGWTTQSEIERESLTPSNPPKGRGCSRGQGRGYDGRGVTHDVPDWIELIEQLRQAIEILDKAMA